jgi:opacity protein-like surface antigen
MKRFLILSVLLLAVAATASAAAPCCAVTAVNAKTGEVTVKENATGRSITLRVSPQEPTNGAKLNKTFKVGSKVGFSPVDGGVLKVGAKLQLTVPGFGPVDGVVGQIAAH